MKARKKKKFRFPWHADCQFDLLVDGHCFFQRMLDTILHAKHFILFEIYLIESGRIASQFIEAFIQAKKRGVSIFLVFDDYGAAKLSHQDRALLTANNIEPVFFNPINYKKFYRSLRRDHRKILIIDGQVAFVGGTGITDEFDPIQAPEKRWHDVMVEIKGPIIHDWIKVFSQTWQDSCGEPVSLPQPNTMPVKYEQLGRATVAEGPHIQEINRSFINRIRHARHCVWLATPYFVAALKIRRALKRAAIRRTDVRLLLPGPISDHPWISHAARGFYTKLLKQGVRIFEYQPRFLHAKIEICDNWISIGSSNLDRWNQRWNRDANQEIEDPDFANTVRAMLRQDFSDSIEVTLEYWLSRPWYQRLREWFWGHIILMLEYLGRSYKK